MSSKNDPDYIKVMIDSADEDVGPLIKCKRILGDRMQWFGSASSGGFVIGDDLTCWELDGSGRRATHGELMLAAGQAY